MRIDLLRAAFLLGLLAVSSRVEARPAPGVDHAALRQALTFHAPFDAGANAQFGKGDLALYHAPSLKKRHEAQPGLPPSSAVQILPGAGRFGDALRFTEKPPLLFFRAEHNMAYREREWSGTVSLWLRVDPETELAPGYTDPVQITPRAWNDAAFFVEFGIETPRPFRLGAYPDFKVWNPDNRDWKDIPPEEKPLFGVERPPFSAERWTHVVFTFDRFNTGQPDGVARLYLDGVLQGEISARPQTFTWDPAQTLIMIGLDYLGMLDELALFDRALTGPEVRLLHELPQGVHSLLAAVPREEVE